MGDKLIKAIQGIPGSKLRYLNDMVLNFTST